MMDENNSLCREALPNDRRTYMIGIISIALELSRKEPRLEA